MTEPKRLFDFMEYQRQHSPLEDMLAGKEDGIWRKYSTDEISNTVNAISAGLLKLGISCNDKSPEGRDKVAIVSKNRPEWLMIDMAVQQIGAVLTPIYPTINVNELEFILQDAEVKIIVVNDESLCEKVQSITSRLPHLQEIYSFDKVVDVKHWKEILNNEPGYLEQVKTISKTIVTDDIATIIYTSGTTGKPKGVMLSHKNIVSNVLSSTPCLPPDKNMKALSFLPLNHIFEKMISYLYLYSGTSIY